MESDRWLIEDVLQRTDQNLVHVRIRGGATKTLKLAPPLSARALRQTSTQVVDAGDGLIAHHADKEIARILNERGMRPGEGRAPHRLMVRRIRLACGLKSRYERLREAGYLTSEEIAAELGVAVGTVKAWRYRGWLRATAYDDHLNVEAARPGPRSVRKGCRIGILEQTGVWTVTGTNCRQGTGMAGRW